MFVCLFVCLLFIVLCWRIFPSYGDVTMAMTGETMVGLGSALMSREGSLSCHTCYGKGPLVCGLIPKDCLNVVASYEKQGKQKNQTFVSLLSFLLFLPCFLYFFLFFCNSNLVQYNPPTPRKCCLKSYSYIFHFSTDRQEAISGYMI